MTTVLLLAHPDFGTSRANRALLSGLDGVPDLEVTELYALYPDGRIDGSVERERLLRATRLVFQFPLQWYSTPALLKQWQDTVLTAGGRGRDGGPAALRGDHDGGTVGELPARRPGHDDRRVVRAVAGNGAQMRMAVAHAVCGARRARPWPAPSHDRRRLHPSARDRSADR